MSGSSKRRHSKWDNKDSEALPEDFYDRAQTRRPREPLSPGRGSRRHDSRSKESTMTWDREGNCTQISPGLDEWRPRHSSRSPRNGWSRSHRTSQSRSRSRSRSQSPAPNFRREPTSIDRSRSRSGVSAQICRDFAAGRCRRGNSCHFLHQDEVYDNRRLDCSSPDDWESRRQRTGSSRYSPDDTKDSAIRTEKSAHICSEFLKGRCRRGDSCRYVHDDSAVDVFEKGAVEDVYRNRNHDLRSRDIYPDHEHRSRDSYRDLDHRRRDTYTERNHEFEPPKRGETPCKFFAAGNCRNGNRCKFSHQVQESFSPDSRRSRGDRRYPDHKSEGGQVWDGPKWSDATTVSAVQGRVEDKNGKKEANNTVRNQGDERGPDHKYEGDRAWDGPSWSDVTTVPNVPAVHGWEEDKNKIAEVAKDVTRLRPGDDCWNHDMHDIKQQEDTSSSISKPEIQDKKQPLEWTMENNVPDMGLSAPRNTEYFSGDIEISPRGIKQQGVNSSTSQTPSISSSVYPSVQKDVTGDASYEKHHQAELQKQKVFHDPSAEQNPNYKDNKSMLYSGERRDIVLDHDGSCMIQNQPLNIPPQGQGIFQHGQSVNVHPMSTVSPPLGQSQPLFPSYPPPGQSQPSFPSYPPPGQSQPSLPSHPPPGQSHPSLPSHPPPGQSQPSLPSHPPPGQSHPSLPSHPPPGHGHNQPSLPTHPPPGQSQLSLPSYGLPLHPPPGQSQLSLPPQPPRGETMQVSHDPSSAFLENIVAVADGSHVVSLASSAIAPVSSTEHSTVSNEQLAQLSHLTASLTQLLENRQQSSQFSTAVTPHGLSNLPDIAAAHVPSVSAAIIHANQGPEVLKPYDPHEGGIVAASKDEKNGKTTAEGTNKAPENGRQDTGDDDGGDDDKKLKDTKGLRAFKFALAEFVKEILKPSWKDGQVSKDAYKTIVKKVVDKVMETLGPQIPQTKEKIDMYLSCSKPKIEKLVQAYVGKHQKS
ncbi:hypothetical protein SOVF_032730 [Spinacia oleracea]|nr:hypothetical protein SOVF_032730 [Spinacia oleracea]